MLYLTNADVQRVLDLPATLDALRQGYADLARDGARLRRAGVMKSDTTSVPRADRARVDRAGGWLP